MIAVIATFTVSKVKADRFEGVARDLIAKVRANEPGVTLYKLARARKEPNLFKFMELYASKDAFKAHGGTDYFQQAFAAMKPLLAGDPLIEVLEEIA